MEDKEKKRSNLVDIDHIYSLAKRGSVFISHSNKDKEIALDIAHAFLEHDIAVFIDVFILRLGDDCQVKLTEALEEAIKKGFFLVLLSPDSLESNNVRREVEFALNKQAKIIPIIVRDPEIVISQLVSLNIANLYYTDFTKGNFNNNMTDLIEFVKTKLDNIIEKKDEIFRPQLEHLIEPEIQEKTKLKKKFSDIGHNAFICYSSKDKKIADATCHFLEENGIKCWIAPRDVSSGSYASSIVKAIKVSKLLILIFTNNANLSSQVKRELEQAVKHGITIQPFRTEDVEPTDEIDYYISSEHWLDALTPPLEDHLSKLAEMVSKLLHAISA